MQGSTRFVASVEQGQVREEAQKRAVPTLLLAAACGIVAANIYYLQPLAALVARSVGLPEASAGLFAAMTQIGYGIGLVLVVPLADLVENRHLVAMVLGLAVAALIIAALAPQASILLPAAFLIGVGAVGVQLVVVYAAHLAAESERGRVIGVVTSGLMLGIMLSRPAASAVAAWASWRIVLGLAAVLTAGIALGLHIALPERRPDSPESYRGLTASLPGLFRANSIVRYRTFIHCNLFFGFGLFWTAVPLVLRDRFQFSQTDIALYALTGIASVLAAPVAGRLADRGHASIGTAASILLVAAGFGAAMVETGDRGELWLLGAAALLIGAGVTGHAVFGQRDVFGMPPAVRARLNGLFMAAYFVAGALGSAAAGSAYVVWGWRATCALGLAAAAIAALRSIKPGHVITGS